MNTSSQELQRSKKDPFPFLMEKMSDEHRDLYILEVSSSYFTAEELKRGYRSFGSYAHSLNENSSVIYIRKDHQDYACEYKRIATLCHEYGHYVARTKLYKRTPIVGKRIYNLFIERPPASYWWNWGFATNCVVILEEILAWMIAYYYLFILNLLEFGHLSYGWSCFKTYLPRLKYDAFYFRSEK
jgi:hypothetical protein